MFSRFLSSCRAFALGSLFLAVPLFSIPAAQAQAQTPESSDDEETKPVAPLLDPKFMPHEYREDFSSLTLFSSHLLPGRPALGQRDDNPKVSFIREHWQLYWRPADEVELYICLPRNIKNPPVILYLYGYPADFERYKKDDWCTTTTDGGFAAVGFVSFNNGPRIEMQPGRVTFFNDLQRSLGATVHDVPMILDYLSSRGDLDMTRVGMFGEGTGGSIAILASAADPRIKAIDLLTPWGDWPEFFATSPAVSKGKRAQFTSPEYLEKVANLDPLKWLPHVQAKSVRIQDVRGPAGVMPDALLDKMEGAAPDFTVINRYGDSTAFRGHMPTGALPMWLQAQLKPESKSVVAMGKTERIHTYPAAGQDDPLGTVPAPTSPPKN